MARGRFRRVKRFFGRAKRYARSKSSSISPMKAVLFGGLYGAVRTQAHNMAAPLTNMIPLGQYSDEAAFGVLGYIMAKQGNSLIKNAGMAILTIESASLGQQALGGMMGGNASSSGFKGY
jgi:ABC-type thiamin/hydroxymethylpyrimidine transport system permease subunit